MKKRFSGQQIISILREAEAGVSARELCRKHAISDATFYTWRKKYGGTEPELVDGFYHGCAGYRAQDQVPDGDRRLWDFWRSGHTHSGQHCAISWLSGYNKNRAGAGDLQREKKTILFSYNQICDQKNYHKLNNKQFDRQFIKLKQQEFGSVIIPALEGRKGWFRFKENMLRGYVRMMAEINDVRLDFERRFTANEPSAQVVPYRSSSYQPLTPIEDKIYRRQRKENESKPGKF